MAYYATVLRRPSLENPKTKPSTYDLPGALKFATAVFLGWQLCG